MVCVYEPAYPTGIGMKQKKTSILFDLYVCFRFKISHTYDSISFVLSVKECKNISKMHWIQLSIIQFNGRWESYR